MLKRLKQLPKISKLFAVSLLALLSWEVIDKVNADRQPLRLVDCWFTSAANWPKSRCYRFTLPEQHGVAVAVTNQLRSEVGEFDRNQSGITARN